MGHAISLHLLTTTLAGPPILGSTEAFPQSGSDKGGAHHRAVHPRRRYRYPDASASSAHGEKSSAFPNLPSTSIYRVQARQLVCDVGFVEYGHGHHREHEQFGFERA